MGNQLFNMKFLVLFSIVACASAVQLVAYPNGAVAPAKTPEVVAAEAAHFAAKGVYAPYHGYNGYYGAGYPYAHGAYAHGAYAPAAYAHGAWAGNYGHAGYPYAYAGAQSFYGLVAHPNGAIVPVDAPDVAAAKAAHFAAHGLPLAAPVAVAYDANHVGLVAHPNGALVPAEPADVVAARDAHLAAHL